MTPRYAVLQNAQQLPLFLQGEPSKAFLVGFWLAWLGFWLASGWLSGWFLVGFWLVLVGFWLAWLSFFSLVFLARLAFCKRIYKSLFCSHTPARSVLGFESFAGRGHFLDGRVPGASQVEYPFGKPPLNKKTRICKWGVVLLQRSPLESLRSIRGLRSAGGNKYQLTTALESLWTIRAKSLCRMVPLRGKVRCPFQLVQGW